MPDADPNTEGIERLRDNLQAVRERIASAAKQAGREPRDVCLVAVTKYVPASTADQLARLGCLDLGESRPQILWEKQASLPDRGIRWHLVGPLQRNKIRRTLPSIALVHSVDSFRLAVAIDRIATELQLSVDVLVEVNVSSELSKQGLAPDLVESEITEMATLSAVRVRGLMCMSGLHSDGARKSQEFAVLRELRDKLRQVAPQGRQLTELSMGMSDDFELAIAEGATIVRLGSVLWEGL